MQCAYCERRATTGTAGDCVPACEAHVSDASEAADAVRRAVFVGNRVADVEWARRVLAMQDAARASAARPGHARGWRMF